MFNDTKYTKWYNDIISAAMLRADNRKDANKLLGYSERHHIIPKCLNGGNSKENLVYLSAREHFLCHLFLIKMIDDSNIKRKMQFALGKFIQCNKDQCRRFTSREYDIIRKTISIARTGYTHSEETIKKISDGHKGQIPWNKDMKLSPISDEHKATLTNLYANKSFEDRYGSVIATEIKIKISDSKKGKPSGMLGKLHSTETKLKMKKPKPNGFSEKISEARTGIIFTEEHLANLKNANIENGLKRRGIKKDTLTCPHCNKVGGDSQMKRYHFDNCKKDYT